MKIEWSKTAIEDLKSLRAYISEHDPAAAARTATSILSGVESLLKFPGLGRAGRVPHTRELIIPDTSYLVIYHVSDDTVRIDSVMHSARKWPD